MSVRRCRGTMVARSTLKPGVTHSASGCFFRRASDRDIRISGKRSVDQTLSLGARLRHSMWRVCRLHLDVWKMQSNPMEREFSPRETVGTRFRQSRLSRFLVTSTPYTRVALEERSNERIDRYRRCNPLLIMTEIRMKMHRAGRSDTGWRGCLRVPFVNSEEDPRETIVPVNVVTWSDRDRRLRIGRRKEIRRTLYARSIGLGSSKKTRGR